MATIVAPNKVSSNDRFSFTLLLAIAAHALIILGVGFEYIKSHTAPPSTIEVVLTKTKTEEQPDEAKVIAENNQVQSGSVDIDARPTAPEVTKKSVKGDDNTTSDEVKERTTKTRSNEMFAHRNTPSAQAVTDQQTIQQKIRISQEIIRKNKQNIARLISELSEEEQLYAKRPRINHIDTLSAKTAIEAKYIKEWVEKVEIIGNINYPSQARQKRLNGALIMSVLVNHDGDVVSSAIQRSSGEKLLDDAAKKVVRLASPFKQFPLEMKEKYDQLMITRTWVYNTDRKFLTK